MTDRKRFTRGAWFRAAGISGILLAAGIVLAGCSKDPVEPVPVVPEPTFSLTFAGGEFKAAFQTSARGDYVAAGRGAGFQGFIYKIAPDGTEVTHYVFDQNESTEYVEAVLPVDDGGYMVCGDSDVRGWVAKIDSRLQTVENNLYRGSARENNLNAMAPLPDGGFLAGGEYDWDRTMSTGNGWLMKVTASGVYESQSVFDGGGGARDYILAITPAVNGGFFFGGGTYPTATADVRAWICKTNSTANALVWNKSYIYSRSTTISGLVATSDGGCMCAGGTTRMETPTSGASDAYLLRVNANGDEMWSNRSGLDGSDYYYAIARAHDGGYVCAGVMYQTGEGWLVKVDDNGNTVWERKFPGGTLYSVKQTSGNGYVCSGKKDGNAWLLRVDINGNFE